LPIDHRGALGAGLSHNRPDRWTQAASPAGHFNRAAPRDPAFG
jgi:hypothetical protein